MCEKELADLGHIARPQPQSTAGIGLAPVAHPLRVGDTQWLEDIGAREFVEGAIGGLVDDRRYERERAGVVVKRLPGRRDYLPTQDEPKRVLRHAHSSLIVVPMSSRRS